MKSLTTSMEDFKIMESGKELTTRETMKDGKLRGHNPWTSIMGGDGMQIQIDNRNSNIVYYRIPIRKLLSRRLGKQ